MRLTTTMPALAVAATSLTLIAIALQTGCSSDRSVPVVPAKEAQWPFVSPPVLGPTEQAPPERVLGAGEDAAPVTQVSFALFDGKAVWGHAGVVTGGQSTTWIGDALPADGIDQGDGGEVWNWTSSDPAPGFGDKAVHPSIVAAGEHQHWFTFAQGQPLKTGSTMFGEVWIDPAHVPTEIQLSWNQNGSWHRAYWGEDKIKWGGKRLGDVPAAGAWTRLEVSSKDADLEHAFTGRVPPAVADTDGPKTLDLSAYHVTFDEEFDKLPDVSAWGKAADGHQTAWIAHTPWDGDFGDAAFANPEEWNPFSVKDGILTITAVKDEKFAASDKWKRIWRAGCLASNDPKGVGFSQQYGYFVCRAKMPGGPGVWPAFWLISSYDRTNPDAGKTGAVEIDVNEYYGSRTQYQATLHLWEPQPHRATGVSIFTSKDFSTTGFHDYGVMVDPQWITMYTDNVAVWKIPTPPEHNKPLMLLVNLALGSGWPTDKVPNPCTMDVDYMKVYAKNP